MTNKKTTGTLGPISSSILDYLAEHPGAANKAIANHAEIDCKHCFDTLRHLLDSGRIVRRKVPGKMTYYLAHGVTAPGEVYTHQLKDISAALGCKAYLCGQEISSLLGITESATRRMLNYLVKTGQLFLSPGIGYFLNEKASLKWKATRPRSKRPMRQVVRFEAANLHPVEILPGNNTIFEECRQNWQGYQIHKAFGSARA